MIDLFPHPEMAIARFAPRTKPCFPAVLGSLLVLIGFWTVWLAYRGNLDRSSLLLTAAFLVAGGWILSIAIRQPIVFQISEDDFVSGRLRIPLAQIEMAKVRRVWISGGKCRFLELRLRQEVKLPFSWRTAYRLNRMAFRASLAGKEYRLPPGPYLLFPLMETDKSDLEIEMSLNPSRWERFHGDARRLPE